MVNFRPFAYSNLIFNSPLSEERADSLLKACSPAKRVLDLGCGWGEMLLRMLRANPQATGVGIDSDNEVLERGRILAANRGLSDRVKFICADAAVAQGEYDLVISIGATHVWGNDSDALRFFHGLIAPQRKLLFGTGIYMKEPQDEIREIFGELPTLEAVKEIVLKSGFEIKSIESATTKEWDSFESSWRSGLATLSDPELITFAAERKVEYENGYRGVLGFCYMVGIKR